MGGEISGIFDATVKPLQDRRRHVVDAAF